MRLKLTLIAILLAMSFECFSQDSYFVPDDFNKWSLDGAVGFTKPYRSFSEGYWTPKVGFLASDLGVRYMFNEYFGLKFDLGYNYYHRAKKSKDFSTDQYKTSLQGVINAGRILKFQTWTQTLNLLVHGGIGIGSLKYHEPTNSNDIDDVINAVAGLTGQVRLSDRVSLNLGLNGFVNLKQDHSFDGGEPNSLKAGLVLNGTAGVSVYLGKKKRHADWYLREDAIYSKLNSNRNSLETKLENSAKAIEDKDFELNELSKQMKLLEKEISHLKEKVDNNKKSSPKLKDQVLEKLADNGYLNIYFDFNSSEIDKSSLTTINHLLNLMQNNTDLSIALEGFTDESGNEDYNLKLSRLRAESVREYLVELGIDGDRVSVKGKGGITGTEQKSKLVKQSARRVSVKFLK